MVGDKGRGRLRPQLRNWGGRVQNRDGGRGGVRRAANPGVGEGSCRACGPQEGRGGDLPSLNGDPHPDLHEHDDAGLSSLQEV